MAERDFGTELMRGARAVGWHPVRIPDGGRAERFADPRPYDLVLIAPPAARVFPAELKQVRSGLSLAMAALADHQEDALQDARRVGARALVVVNFRLRLSKRQQKLRGVAVLNRAWAVPVEHLVRERTDEARTGLPLEWWEQHGTELPRLEGCVGEDGSPQIAWDPRPLAGLS